MFMYINKQLVCIIYFIIFLFKLYLYFVFKNSFLIQILDNNAPKKLLIIANWGEVNEFSSKWIHISIFCATAEQFQSVRDLKTYDQIFVDESQEESSWRLDVRQDVVIIDAPTDDRSALCMGNEVSHADNRKETCACSFQDEDLGAFSEPTFSV